MDIQKLSAPYEIIRIDPWLAPYSGEIDLRMDRFKDKRKQLVGTAEKITDFADGYLYFGIHRTEDGWAVREWLPGADGAWLTGDFNGWSHDTHPMTRKENGVWEIHLKGKNALKHGQFAKLWVKKGVHWFDRLPAYCTKVSMDEDSKRLCSQVWDPKEAFQWTDEAFMKKA